MWNSDNLKRLADQAEQGAKLLDQNMSVFDEMMRGMGENIPKEYLERFNSIKAKTTAAIDLAKQGKSEEAQAIIKTIQP